MGNYLFKGVEETPKEFKLQIVNLDAVTDNMIIKEVLSEVGLNGMQRLYEIFKFYLEEE